MNGKPNTVKFEPTHYNKKWESHDFDWENPFKINQNEAIEYVCKNCNIKLYRNVLGNFVIFSPYYKEKNSCAEIIMEQILK